jgi:hypothetical protein
MDIGHVLIVIFKHVLAVWNTVRVRIHNIPGELAQPGQLALSCNVATDRLVY